MARKPRRKHRDAVAHDAIPALPATTSPSELRDTANRNVRISNLITIVCTVASLSPLFLREKFLAAAIPFAFGVMSILYTPLVVRPLSRKLALVIGSVLMIEGTATALYRGLQPEVAVNIPGATAPAVNAATAMARASFNETRERHYPVVQVASTSADPGCTTCWKPTVEAKPGDLLSFNILVVNTAWGAGTETGVAARNVTVNFATEQAGAGLIASAKISAENAAPIAGIAQVHVPPGYRDVRFSAIWEAIGYRYEKHKWNRTEAPGVPPTFYLGDVLPGWTSQRVIILQYQVEGAQIKTRSGCVPPRADTLKAGVIRASSAALRGAGRTTDTTRSWFDFGVTEGMGWSVEDADGVGIVRGLRPGTAYYYRYVVQDKCGVTAFGNTRSFTTPQTSSDPHDYPDLLPTQN
jgi:hypothetical protein